MSSLLWRAMKWFLFRLDAETAHLFTVALIRIGIRLGGTPLRISGGVGRIEQKPSPVGLPEVFGVKFRSRLGLAAGFDKNAEMVRGLPSLGFGFAEIGTVTPRPQPGNDRPRLFRDPSRLALFNRMGFNSLGAAVVSDRLRTERPGLPLYFRVGVNVGKNKETPLGESPRDYGKAIRAFQDLADYIVINVSSPNTPGLRSLQTVESLKPIIEEANRALTSWEKRPPLLLKLAPEIRGGDLASLLQAIEPEGVDGWVLTNTLGGEWAPSKQVGGWSGGPLTVEASARLEEARAATRLPIISVGGIMTPEEAASRLRKGASLVQVYSGWIYNGPRFPREIADFLGKSGL